MLEFADTLAETAGSPGGAARSSGGTRGIRGAPPPGRGAPGGAGTRPAPGSSTWRRSQPGAGSSRAGGRRCPGGSWGEDAVGLAGNRPSPSQAGLPPPSLRCRHTRPPGL